MSPEVEQQVIVAIKEGQSYRSIAAQIGKSIGSVHNYVKALREAGKIPPPPPPLPPIEKSVQSGVQGSCSGSAERSVQPSTLPRLLIDVPESIDPAEMVRRLDRFAYRLLLRIEHLSESEGIATRDAVGAMKVSAELSTTIRRAMREAEKAERGQPAEAEWDRLQPKTWSSEQRQGYRETGELPDGPPQERM